MRRAANSLTQKQEGCGVYFVADDFASEWTIALLNSLHTYPPKHNVWCIPFSEEISGLRRLAADFGFGIYDDRSHWAGFSPDPQMPHYEIYRHFRLHSSSRIEQLKWNVRKWVTTTAHRFHLLAVGRRLLARFCRLAHHLRSRRA